MPTLTIIRGLPGSGKSTLAKELDNHPRVKRFEADMYMIDENGNYEFSQDRLMYCHTKCRENTRNALIDGYDVIVSNTFTTKKEIKPYLDIARQCNADVNIILCQNNFGSIHDVPEETMQRMRDRFDFNPF